MSATLEYLLEPFDQWLSNEANEDVAVQQDSVAWVYSRGKFTSHTLLAKDPQTGERTIPVDATWLEDLAIVAAAQRHQDVGNGNPMLKTDLPGRGRVQVVLPPYAQFPTLSIRRGSDEWPVFKDLVASGLFKKTKRTRPEPTASDTDLSRYYLAEDWDRFLSLGVRSKKNIILAGPNGSGKAQPLDAKVLTPTGFRTMGSLKPGDLVQTPSGATAAIVGVFPQGEKEIYRVTFEDDRAVLCCGEHLWKVWKWATLFETGKSHKTRRHLSNGRWVVEPLSKIKTHLDTGSQRARLRGVPLVAPLAIEHPPATLPIPPYALGCMLGDGHLHASSGVRISTVDQPILDRLLDDLPLYKATALPYSKCDYLLALKVRSGHMLERLPTIVGEGPPPVGRGRTCLITHNGATKRLAHWAAEINISPGVLHRRIYRWKWPLDEALGISPRTGNPYARSPMTLALKKLGLSGARSHNKFVPEQYKAGSVAQRLALIQGLMDTDGTVGSGGMGGSFSSTSERLARDVQEIVWSLGAVAKIAPPRITSYTYKGEKKFGRPSWRVSIKHPEIANFFSLPRKGEKCRAKTDRLRLRIVKIEPVGIKAAQCIAIDHPDQLYVTDNYVVTHNTHLSKALMGEIPLDERLVTIEKSAELRGLLHPNRVQLYNDPSKAGSPTPAELVEAALQLRIGRLFLQELLSGEDVLAYLIGGQTGHRGAITTIHANTCAAVFDRMRVLIKQASGGASLSDVDINSELHSIVDIICHFTERDVDGFSVDEVWFKPVSLGEGT